MRYSAIYLLARGGPGLINFIALALYTRLLTPAEYGQYALVIAGVGLVQAVGFQWLGLCLTRFLPENQSAPERFLSEIKFLFIVLAVACTAAGGVVIALLWSDPVWKYLATLALPLLVAHAWFDLGLTHAAAELEPARYGRINLTKSAVSLVVGAILAWLGLGASSPLWGLLLGVGLATLLFGRSAWRSIKSSLPDRNRVKVLLAYGMPLAANFSLVWVISSSDRFLLGGLLNVDSAGQYAVGYGLAQYSMGMLLMIVNLAAYPLVIYSFEHGGSEAAREQLKKSGAVIFSLAFTAAGGIAVLAPLLGSLLPGAEYADSAVELLPWVALAAALSGIKAYYFDTAFHLGRNTVKLVWISLGVAIVNVVSNLIWIPHSGIMGAAYATVLAYALGTAASAWFGRRLFTLPALAPLLMTALTVSVPTAFIAWLVMQGGGWTGLGLGLSAGTATAALCAIGINLGGVRQELWQRVYSHMGGQRS